MIRYLIAAILLLTFSNAHAQTLGGNTGYNFLSLPASTNLTAAGGVNVSHAVPDVSFALSNPALLNEKLNGQVGLNFLQGIAGITGYTLGGSYYSKAWSTAFGTQVSYFDYGQLDQSDAAGNVFGRFHATDYVVQLSAAKRYLQKWQYGGSIKFIQSHYPPYSSTALAIDFGLHYTDSTHGFNVGLLAKNMGAPIKSFAGSGDELPFDLQVGITKRLAKAPIAFSLTIQQAHRFNLLYRDSSFNNENVTNTSASTTRKILQHVVFATHIYLSNELEATVGFNQLRRADLSVGTMGNGLTGFSAGLAARFEKLHVSFARSSYQRGIAYNQFGLNVMLDKLFGAGLF